MEYKLVSDQDKTNLELRVNTLLKDGWKLHSPLIFEAHPAGYCCFVQPMIKE